MSDDVRELPVSSDSAESSSAVDGPLRSFAFGRRAVLQSLATGVGAAVLASPAAAHVHQAAAPSAAKPAAPAARAGAGPALVFLDKHAFDTLAILGDQIVPGSRAARCPNSSIACSRSSPPTRRSASPRPSAPSSARRATRTASRGSR